jgi:group II intron reverse transcriptase/maturase
MHHLTPELITQCLNAIPDKSATDVDGITVEQVKANLSWMLPPILKAIHQRRYQAPPVRRVYIPKPDGRKRPLGIPTVLDRAIQAAMAQILNQIYEQDFIDSSFGFRQGRGCHNALATLGMLIYEQKMLTALEVDIRDFFGTIDHCWMVRFLEHRVGDRRVIKLIKAWLKAGTMDQGAVTQPELGTAQGGSISPLLANIYLHYVLDLWWDKKILPKLAAKAALVRYCDDFVLLFKSSQDAQTVHHLLKVRLAQFGLHVADEKTHMTDLGPKKPGDGNRRRRIDFLGFTIYRTRTRSKTRYKVVYRTQSKRFARSKKAMRHRLRQMMHDGLEAQSAYLCAVLRGHYNYYGLAGNSQKLQRFWNEARKAWRFCLSKRSQRGQYSWQQMKRKVFEQYPLPLPRIKIGYRQLRSYAIGL